MNLDRDHILNEVMDKSKGFWKVKMIHASGHGGQNKDHGNSKAQLTFDINKFFEIFELDEQKWEKFIDIVWKKQVHHEQSVLILENQEQRSAKMNEENVLKHLRQIISELFEDEKERVETKVPKHEKEKRLQDKKHHSQKKEHRKKPDTD